jgi:hypothetical protein
MPRFRRCASATASFSGLAWRNELFALGIRSRRKQGVDGRIDPVMTMEEIQADFAGAAICRDA